jgi:hypothetical protein
MEYLNLFNQLDQNLSQKIEDLQKQQEELIEQKKYLLEAKQKIHCFLSDAYEIKQVLDFQPELVTSLQAELNKIFQGETSSKNLRENSDKVNSKIDNLITEEDEELNLDEIVIDTDEQEQIKIFKFVDSQGKDASY